MKIVQFFDTFGRKRVEKSALFEEKSRKKPDRVIGETKKWFHILLAYSYLYGCAKKVLALAEKNKKLFLYFARLFVPLWPKS